MHNIFISHIHQESGIANIVRQALEKEFPGKMKIFCSSDGKSIRAGDDFTEKIDEALSGCKYAIFIVGPHSETSRWINLEYGAIGMRNLKRILVREIPMVPLCHSGLTPETLKIPFSRKVAKVAGDKIQMEGLFGDVAAAIGWKKPIRPKDDLAEEIKKFEINHFPNTESGKYVQELHHVNLPVSNLKTSIDFFCDFLDFKLIERANFRFGGAWFGLPNGQHLHLVEQPGFESLNCRLPVHGDFTTPPDIHFALRVDDKKFEAYKTIVTSKLAPDRFVSQPFPDIPISQLYVLAPVEYLIEITNITPEQKQPKYISREERYHYAYWWRE